MCLPLAGHTARWDPFCPTAQWSCDGTPEFVLTQGASLRNTDEVRAACGTRGVSVFYGEWRGAAGEMACERRRRPVGHGAEGRKREMVGRDGRAKSCRVGGGLRDTQGSPSVIKLCSVLADGLCLEEGGRVDTDCDLGLFTRPLVWQPQPQGVLGPLWGGQCPAGGSGFLCPGGLRMWGPLGARIPGAQVLG